MTLADRIAADTQRFDAVEALTVSQTRDDVTTSAAIENCLPTALNRSETASLGVPLESDVRVFSIPAANLTAASLDGMSVGDFVTDADSVEYKVGSSQLLSLSARWRTVVHRRQTEA